MEDLGSRLTPGITYVDVEGAVRWLEEVLGFRTSHVFRDGDGRPTFVQLAWHRNALFLSPRWGDDDPWATGRTMTSLAVDDAATVDAVHERAVRTGTEVVRPPHLSKTPLFPEGSYQLDVRDPEGNLWTVGTFQPAG